MRKKRVGRKLRFELDLCTIVDEPLLRQIVVDGQDVSMVVTSLVTDISELFSQAETFNQEIRSWVVSCVKDMVGCLTPPFHSTKILVIGMLVV